MRRPHLTLVTAAILVTVSACGQSPAAPSAAGSVSSGGLAAKGGGGKPPSLERAVLADLRCPGALCAGADRVMSDASPYAVAIGSDGNLGFALGDSARRVVFDFTDCVEPCAPARRWFTTASVGMPHDLWMHTSVLVPGTDTETPGGLHDVPVGATWASRIKILFRLIDPGGTEIGWAIRFNPFYPGSTNLQVTRVSATEWLLEATALQRAWLQSQTISRRGGDPAFEGNFVLPFQMRITAQ